MSDWIGLGIIVAIIAGGLWFFAGVGKPYEATPEEFERRARSGGYTRAGMFGLMQLLDPKAAQAVETQRDLKSGYYQKKKRLPGEGEEPEADQPETNHSDIIFETEEKDA